MKRVKTRVWVTVSNYYVTASKGLSKTEKPILLICGLILDPLKTLQILIFLFLQQQKRYKELCHILMTKDTDPTCMYLVDMKVLGIMVYLLVEIKNSVYV